MTSITLYSNADNADVILAYTYDILSRSDKYSGIKGEYININSVNAVDYDYKGKMKYVHLIMPENGHYEINDIKIDIHDYLLNNEIAVFKNKKYHYAIKEIVFTSEKPDVIKDFIEKALMTKKTELNEMLSLSSDKIKKKVFMRYGWTTHSVIPKRDTNTIFLKDGQMQSIKENILSFIDDNTYKDYIKHGIPYKLNILLHGPPGVGKTSVIHTIATLCNANICMLNINEDLKESDMIDAFRSVNENSSLSIVVIEDIDCIFSDRKSLDSHKNHITLNGLLNCMDGFNNQEGLILILTTNFPDKLDSALVRSGRIDMNIELTNLNKFQARNMFMSFFNDDKAFDLLWNKISNYDVAPSSLLQFLFNNRKSDNIAKEFDAYVSELHKKAQKACSLYT